MEADAASISYYMIGICSYEAALTVLVVSSVCTPRHLPGNHNAPRDRKRRTRCEGGARRGGPRAPGSLSAPAAPRWSGPRQCAGPPSPATPDEPVNACGG